MIEALYGKKILFATVPNEAHFNPLTGLAKYLQDAGCDVRWYTSRIFENQLRRLSIPHYVFTKALDINPVNIDYMFPERMYISDQPEKLNFDLVNVFAKRSPEYFADIKKICKSFPFDLMVSDCMFSAVPFVKAKLKVPVVTVGVVPLASDSVDLGSYGMALKPAVTADQHDEYARLRDFVSSVLFKRSIEVYDAILKENNIFIKPSILFDLLIRQSDLHLQIGTKDFEFKRSDLGNNIRFAGALLPYAERIKPWFDPRLTKYNKIVLLSQGNAETDTKKILEPTLEAFKDTDTLVIASTGGSGTVALREKYPAENLIIESFIPFEQVMPYASVCITNGGYMTTLLSIRHKLPVVSAGIYHGKNEVGARVAYFNCGVNLNTESPSPQEIRDAVNEVIANEEYRNSIQRISEGFKHKDANKLCANHIASLINGKVSLQANEN
ncbi:glycosyltransferase [Pedobacter westerhofensis]|nr:nucleotide disphospho-sugar-binding domain-containing protein [Pedobacter westerhofensis]